MKISERWLREWVAPKLDTKALAERLTMAGLEVGATERAAPRLEKVVVGVIKEMRAHPQADRLRCCRVDVGTKTLLEIVCGAPNAAVGMRAPVALPGATLPDGTLVRAMEIRGVPSAGVLCSAAELGLGEADQGLLDLGHAKAGTTLERLLALDDTVLEFDLTPNRGDCLSVAGIAREVAALTGARRTGIKIKRVPAKRGRRVTVRVDDPEACPRYVGRVIENIEPTARTPLWMQERLRRSGLRAIHPVVDVTNYVMLELGQPMHGFDLDRLHGGIRVRRARKGERLTLLDGKATVLEAGMLVIADELRPLALAGIMGGIDSAVTVGTRNVFLESAFFAPAAIAGRARALGVQSESSHRFERGVDPALQREAAERATGLLLDIVGGKPGAILERTARRQLPRGAIIQLRAGRLARVLGVEAVRSRDVEAILRGLGMALRRVRGGWRVSAPTWRFDLEREEDLIEEVARIYGYERIPTRRPRIEMTGHPVPEARVSERRIRSLLIDRDYQEVVTYSFVDPTIQRAVDPETKTLALANPISADMSVMRTTLWPGLLQTIAYNQNRQQSRVRVFEIGRRFVPGNSSLSEQVMVAGAACGPAWAEQWGLPHRPVDFYDIKGDIEALLRLTGQPDAFRFEHAMHSALHPRQAARITRDAGTIGHLGRLHPEVQARLALDSSVILFELLLEAIQVAKVPIFQEISKFPAIRRDISVIVNENTPAAALLHQVQNVAGFLLVNLELFDEYRGKGIDSGRKSVALGLTLQDSSRTLTEGEVDELMSRVVTALESELGAELRR